MALVEPVAFLQIKIDDEVIGFLDIKLNINVTPKTVTNFLKLCSGEVEYKYYHDSYHCYKNSIFHRITRSFCQGGDYEFGTAIGGHAPEGNFKNENYDLKHVSRGVVAMANRDPKKVKSQFYITFRVCDWLDGKHVVFGHVTEESMGVLKRIEEAASDDGEPIKNVVVVGCGEVINGYRVFAANEYTRGHGR
uniref:peptidyl-prolyl cis-trans isomerase-like n=1 Tax=Erigeron canadensis TaxID=72917 RepID=UPI001CB8C3B6|nr:peptidyl-prolyl cis-trans isomerase-like [Erigeron canadensis]